MEVVLQYCCLDNPMVRDVCWAIVHMVAESHTQLSMTNFKARTLKNIYLKNSLYSPVWATKIDGFSNPVRPKFSIHSISFHLCLQNPRF